MNLIDTLPKEINFEIQNHLDRKGAANYLLINKTCYQWLNNNEGIWKKIFPEITFPENISAKKYLDSCAISSCSTLKTRVDDFKKRLQNAQVGKFILLFPFNPGSNLTFEVKFEAEMSGFSFFHGFKPIKALKTALTETYIYMDKMNNIERGAISLTGQESTAFSSRGLTTTNSYFAEVRGANCNGDIAAVFREAHLTVQSESAAFAEKFHTQHANWELQKLAMATVVISSLIFFNWGSA